MLTQAQLAAATAAGDALSGRKGSIERERKLLRKLAAQDEELQLLRAKVRHRSEGNRLLRTLTIPGLCGRRFFQCMPACVQQPTTSDL